MSAMPAEVRKLTPDEYLERERASEERHEFHDGEVFAMSGGTPEHSLIVTNVGAHLRELLRRRPCMVYSQSLRVRIPKGSYVYPDVIVACPRPLLEDSQRDTLLNPKVIVEVLSDSTEDYDRGTKLTSYRTIPSFTDYLLVSQHEPTVEHHARQDDGSWIVRIHGKGARVPIPSIECEVAVDELYLKVFDQA